MSRHRRRCVHHRIPVITPPRAGRRYRWKSRTSTRFAMLSKSAAGCTPVELYGAEKASEDSMLLMPLPSAALVAWRPTG